MRHGIVIQIIWRQKQELSEIWNLNSRSFSYRNNKRKGGVGRTSKYIGIRQHTVAKRPANKASDQSPIPEFSMYIVQQGAEAPMSTPLLTKLEWEWSHILFVSPRDVKFDTALRAFFDMCVFFAAPVFFSAPFGLSFVFKFASQKKTPPRFWH